MSITFIIVIMCGIWGYISLTRVHDVQKLFTQYNTVRHRGPDRSDFKVINEYVKLYLGFHRLAIMDRSTYGDQPFTLEIKGENRSIYALCNGEIYNFHQHVEQNGWTDLMRGRSDCEVIPLMYAKYGFVDMLKQLRSESAICVIDINHSTQTIVVNLGRDHLAVRPMFIGIDENGIAFSSIMSGVTGIVEQSTVRQLGRAEYIISTIRQTEGAPDVVTVKGCYHQLYRSTMTDVTLDQLHDAINKKFTEAVVIRLESDQPIGALLSGGLDSSLVVSIAASQLKKEGKRLRTFSIGIPGSTDREFAEMVAKHCDTDHTHIEFTEQDFLDVIENVIVATETYDITTVRASVGQFLIAKWIRENTDIRVILNGDGSDELTAGYMYFHNAPDFISLHQENLRLLEEIMYYDVLRVDRCIAHNGLEARVPFLDHEFVELYLSIPPEYRAPRQRNGEGRKIEKWLLRSAFDRIHDDRGDGEHYLPEAVLWRKKEAFSDGVSSNQRSWFQIIQETVADRYDENDICSPEVSYHLAPHTKEALHYRLLFNKHFGSGHAHVIPHYWLPRWSGDIKEPSARVLSVY